MSEYTQETYRQAYGELMRTLEAWGLPGEVARMIANQLHAERDLRRMTSYMRNAHPRGMEDIADELLAIMEDRQRWTEKKLNEQSNARWNAWLNSDIRQSED